MTSALEIYDRALTTTEPLEYVMDTRRYTSALPRWRSANAPGDNSLIERCTNSTLDIGCGPGRLINLLTERRVPSLGIDISSTAVRIARARGARVLCRNVFNRIPDEGLWARTILADGNIGIGGDPLRLLRRCFLLLADDGLLLVELDPPGSQTRSAQLRLRVGTKVSDPFPWAFVAVSALPSLAAAAMFCIAETWTEAGRWFAALQKNTSHTYARSA
jgi:SAM-dependent methyltransferase